MYNTAANMFASTQGATEVIVAISQRPFLKTTKIQSTICFCDCFCLVGWPAATGGALVSGMVCEHTTETYASMAEAKLESMEYEGVQRTTKEYEGIQRKLT